MRFINWKALSAHIKHDKRGRLLTELSHKPSTGQLLPSQMHVVMKPAPPVSKRCNHEQTCTCSRWSVELCSRTIANIFILHKQLGT